jgi:hypothetical protein
MNCAESNDICVNPDNVFTYIKKNKQENIDLGKNIVSTQLQGIDDDLSEKIKNANNIINYIKKLL